MKRGRKSSFDRRRPSLFWKKIPPETSDGFETWQEYFWNIDASFKRKKEDWKAQIKNSLCKNFCYFYLNFSPKNAHNSAVQHLPSDVNVGIHSFLCGETFHAKKTARNCLIKKFLCKNILHRRKTSGGKNDNFWKVYEPQTTKNKSSFIKVYGELLFFSFLPGLHIKTIFSFSE